MPADTLFSSLNTNDTGVSANSKVTVTNYLPEIWLFLFSLFSTFVLQTLVLSSTFSCCYLTPLAYFLQPQTSLYISLTNYGGSFQIPFCSLSMPFQVLSSVFAVSIFLSINNWSFVPLEILRHPFCSSGNKLSLSRC